MQAVPGGARGPGGWHGQGIGFHLLSQAEKCPLRMLVTPAGDECLADLLDKALPPPHGAVSGKAPGPRVHVFTPAQSGPEQLIHRAVEA